MLLSDLGERSGKESPGSLVVGRTKKITSVSALRSLLYSVGDGGGAACCCFPCPPSLSPGLPRSLPPRPIRRRGAVAVAVAIALPPRPPDGQFVRTTILIQIRSCAAKERGRQTGEKELPPPSLPDPCFSRFGDFCVTARPNCYSRERKRRASVSKDRARKMAR